MPTGFRARCTPRWRRWGGPAWSSRRRTAGSAWACSICAVLAEEMGRAVLPGPFFSSSVLAALTLLHGGSAALKKQWLPRLAAGEAIGTLAFLEASDRLDPAGIATRCTKTRTGYRLNGTKMFVTDAHVADCVLVAARTRGQDEAGVCVVARAARHARRDDHAAAEHRRHTAAVRGRAATTSTCRLRRWLRTTAKGWTLLSRVLDAAAVLSPPTASAARSGRSNSPSSTPRCASSSAGPSARSRR